MRPETAQSSQSKNRRYSRFYPSPRKDREDIYEEVVLEDTDVAPMVEKTATAHRQSRKKEDLSLLSQGVIDRDDPGIMQHMRVCMYRNSTKSYQSTLVRLVRRNGSSRTDLKFFVDMRAKYKAELRGPLRRVISFKTVSTARLLRVSSVQFHE